MAAKKAAAPVKKAPAKKAAAAKRPANVTEALAIAQRVALEEKDAEIATLTHDLELIGTELRQAAVEADLCRDFDRFVKRVNLLTSRKWLQPIHEMRTTTLTIAVTYDPDIADPESELVGFGDYGLEWESVEVQDAHG